MYGGCLSQQRVCVWPRGNITCAVSLSDPRTTCRLSSFSFVRAILFVHTVHLCGLPFFFSMLAQTHTHTHTLAFIRTDVCMYGVGS